MSMDSEVTAWLATAFLSVLFASAELFSRFKDEPFFIFKRSPAVLYILFHTAMALGTLLLITRTDVFGHGQDTEWYKAVLVAGLGSAALLRSKLFNVTVQGKEVAIGPEMIVSVFLETLQSKIDRDRSLARKEVVEQCMEHVDFTKAGNYVLTTVVAARQAASPEETRKLMDGLQKIDQSRIEMIDKGYALGYLVLDIMGEAFLKNLFNDRNKDRFKRTD